MYRGNVKHVFVLANFRPKVDTMSADRWVEMDVTEYPSSSHLTF